MLNPYSHDSSSIVNTSALSSPSVIEPHSNGRIVRSCAVCGDSPAKLHYGVLACFGCKGFFRRAVKEGRNKYLCRYEKQCKVDKYERNTCRWCRFRKCLLVGMNPDSVKPDRNESNNKQKSRLVRMNSSVKSVHTSAQFRLTRQDSGRTTAVEDSNEDELLRPLTQAQKQLLSSISRLDAKCAKDCRNQRSESVLNFTLKSLINDRLLDLDDQARTHFESRDNSLHALWRIVFTIDWINALSCMAVQGSESAENITVEDKIAIIQSVFSRIVVFRMCMQRVLDEDSVENSDLNLLRCFDDDSLFNSALEDIVRPLKKSGITRNELLLLQAIISVDPAIKGIRPAASDLLLEFRNKLQELLISVIKRARRSSSIDVNAQFGNYLLLFPTIMVISDRVIANLRHKFPLNSTNSLKEFPHLGIIKTLAHPDTTDYLRFPQLNRKIFAVEKQESPIEKQQMPTPSTYNTWQSFASAFTNIQMPQAFTYNPPNLSIMPGLSPNSTCSSIYSSTSNPFPGQPLPEPSPSATSTVSIGPPLTITAATPPINHTQFMPFHSSPPESDNRNQQQNICGQSQMAVQNEVRNNLDVPPTSNACNIIPKLPLHLTKSFEEMLRPAGSLPEDQNFWNKPLAMDWADMKVDTPSFNHEIVAKFFPECATTSKPL